MQSPLFDVRSLRLRRPAEVLRRAARKTSSRLTTPVTGEVARIDARHTGYALARAGAWCGRCVKVCPWTKPAGLVHDLVRLAAARAPRTDPLWVALDEWLGYGRPRPDRQWWLDLERTADGFRNAGRDT